MKCNATLTTAVETDDLMARTEYWPDGVAVVCRGYRLMRLDVTCDETGGPHTCKRDSPHADHRHHLCECGVRWFDWWKGAVSHADNTPPDDVCLVCKDTGRMVTTDGTWRPCTHCDVCDDCGAEPDHYAHRLGDPEGTYNVPVYECCTPPADVCEECGQTEGHWRHREEYQPAAPHYYHDFTPPADAECSGSFEYECDLHGVHTEQYMGSPPADVCPKHAGTGQQCWPSCGGTGDRQEYPYDEPIFSLDDLPEGPALLYRPANERAFYHLNSPPLVGAETEDEGSPKRRAEALRLLEEAAERLRGRIALLDAPQCTCHYTDPDDCPVPQHDRGADAAQQRPAVTDNTPPTDVQYERYCNKCGYIGPDERHDGCRYSAWETDVPYTPPADVTEKMIDRYIESFVNTGSPDDPEYRDRVRRFLKDRQRPEPTDDVCPCEMEWNGKRGPDPYCPSCGGSGKRPGQTSEAKSYPAEDDRPDIKKESKGKRWYMALSDAEKRVVKSMREGDRPAFTDAEVRAATKAIQRLTMYWTQRGAEAVARAALEAAARASKEQT